ncbi:MAG: hypothetical protein ACRDT5_25270 [Mycobacterium sp.]
MTGRPTVGTIAQQRYIYILTGVQPLIGTFAVRLPAAEPDAPGVLDCAAPPR